MNTEKIMQNVAKVDGFMFDKDLGYMVSYNDLDQLTMDILVMYYDLDNATPFTTVDGNAVSWTDITDTVHEHDQEYICDAYNRGVIGIYTINQVIAGDDARLVVYGTNGCLNGVRYALINENDEPIWGILPDPKPYQDMFNDELKQAHEQASNTNTIDEDDIVDYDDDEDDDEYDYDYDDDEDDDQEFMELDFAELQRYLTACNLAALDAHDEQNWHGENWWIDRALLAKRDFLNTYGLSWSDYDKLEQEYKRQK